MTQPGPRRFTLPIEDLEDTIAVCDAPRPSRLLQLVRVAGSQLQVYPLATSEVVLGSAPDCELRVQDPTVSAHHCVIRLDGISYVIRDLSSTNGTRVDGVHIKEVYLRVGCVIRIGNTTFHVEAAAEGEFA